MGLFRYFPPPPRPTDKIIILQTPPPPSPLADAQLSSMVEVSV